MSEKARRYYLRHTFDETTMEELLAEDDDGTLDTFVRSEDIPKLRAEWEEELLSDGALKAAADCFYPDIWPGDETEMTAAEKASTSKVMLEQALAAINEGRDDA